MTFRPAGLLSGLPLADSLAGWCVPLYQLQGLLCGVSPATNTGPGGGVAAASTDSSPCSGPRLESPPGLFLDVGTCPGQSRLGLEGRGRLEKPVARPEASLGPKLPRWEFKPQRNRQCTSQRQARPQDRERSTLALSAPIKASCIQGCKHRPEALTPDPQWLD